MLVKLQINSTKFSDTNPGDCFMSGDCVCLRVRQKAGYNAVDLGHGEPLKFHPEEIIIPLLNACVIAEGKQNG